MTPKKARVLVLGASGMLGHAVFRLYSESDPDGTWGTVRSRPIRIADGQQAGHLISGIDVEYADALTRVFAEVRPTHVVNCVGVVKQLAAADDPLTAVPLNTLLPHRIARLCELEGARLIHISTDCVFAGTKGMYTEGDTPDARDLYGLSKLLGEVDYPHAVTLRTSIIGHELSGAHGLVEWFLAQKSSVKGYTRAVFSGLPTVELARVIRDHVLPHQELRGVYHLSAEPINKYELLTLVAQTYGVQTSIETDDKVVIDRSLDSARFRAATGYRPGSWPELVHAMHEFR
jgi:dTDP-4-dehydrorhamnose reductase